MKKNNVRKHRKIFILIIVIMITAITLAVETYAWFVGLSTASTGDITIAISSADGLDLSLNGQYWTNGGTELKIKDANHTYITEKGCSNANCAYNGHTNIWPEYLNPVSTIGEINPSTSKLKLFEKTSLAANPGGYYITSKPVDNSIIEGNGYVAFDLYIRNGTGSAYNGTYNKDSDENIYLSPDSFASTVVNGNQPDYGAANSVRVGFFEIGRMKSDSTSYETIANMNCNMTNTGVTTLCTGSSNMIKDGTTLYTNDELLSNTWNIWEPNYASHSDNAVNYFNMACKNRTENTYGDPCQPIESGTSKKTYGMKTLIGSNSTNIYDGIDINTYNNTTYLKEMNTYKMSDALSTANDKYPLIKVAGNSITKVRVYIWLEGQDIDNYDIISQNPSVQVKFGLTKDRNVINDANITATNNRSSSFQEDSWEKIKYNVEHNNTSQYHVGDMRTIRIDGNEYRLRLANKNSNTGLCNSTINSQTACGFVVEFVDVITTMKMRDTPTNIGGYPATNVYSYLNEVLYNKLPNDLKNSMIETRVVSSHGRNDSSNFTSLNQKLYLLSSKEVFNADGQDSASQLTMQLEYYNQKGVTLTTNGRYTAKNDKWWLRSADIVTNFMFHCADGIQPNGYMADTEYGIAPAFRIG